MPFESRECSVRDLDPILANGINKYLPAGDRVIHCCEIIYKPIEATIMKRLFGGPAAEHDRITRQVPGPDLYAYVVTQTHLIYAGHFLIINQFTDSAKAFQLNEIEDVQQRQEPHVTSPLSTVTALERGTNPGIKNAILARFPSPAEADNFARVVRQAIEQAPAPKPQAPAAASGSAEERLRALTQLHQQGLISAAEFQQKRQEVLKQL